MHFVYSGTLFLLLGIYSGLRSELAAYGTYFTYVLAAAAVLGALTLCLRRGKAAMVLLPLCLLLLGLVCGLRTQPGAAQLLAPYFGQQAQVLGEVEPVSVYFNDSYGGFVVRCEKLEVQGRNVAYNGRLRVGLKGEAVPQTGRVLVRGTLGELVSLRNPGGFDGSLYNRINNLGARLEKAQLVGADESSSVWQQLQLWNLALCSHLQERMGKEQGALLSGMLLGGSGRLDEETRDTFAANGLAHLLSVSGTHLVMLSGLLLAIFSPLPQPYRSRIVSVLLVLYALLCGLRAPVVRALAMALVLLWCGRGAERGRLLCLVLAAMLCVRPLWLLDIGFQLSFGAAAGLLWLLPACRRALPGFLPAPVTEGAAVTMAAQLAVVPLEVYYFHQVSLISLVSNIVLVPVLELAAQLALIGSRIPGGDVLLGVAQFLLQQVLQQARYLAQLPFAIVVIGSLPAYCGVLYYALLALWADFSWLQLFTGRERRVAIAALALALVATLCWQQQRTLPLTVYFLDVGQGDCAVVVTPSQRVVVIDTGGLKNIATGSRVVAPFLRSLGYSRIDVLLLSHYDFDHVGGAPSLLRQMEVGTLLVPNELMTAESSKMQAEILQQRKISNIKIAHSGEQIELDEQTQLRLVDVPQQQVSGNEASTLAAVRCAQGSVLFTGDMGVEREQNLQLAQQYTVLKAGHHGSRNSTGADFLAQVRPRLTVISCGRGNRYGHPHAETLQRLQEAGSSILRTDELGCIKIAFDAEGIRCYSYADYIWRSLQQYNI